MDIAAKLQAHTMGPHMHPELQDDILEAIKHIRHLEQALAQAGDSIELQEAHQRGFLLGREYILCGGVVSSVKS